MKIQPFDEILKNGIPHYIFDNLQSPRSKYLKSIATCPLYSHPQKWYNDKVGCIGPQQGKVFELYFTEWELNEEGNLIDSLPHNPVLVAQGFIAFWLTYHGFRPKEDEERFMTPAEHYEAFLQNYIDKYILREEMKPDAFMRDLTAEAVKELLGRWDWDRKVSERVFDFLPPDDVKLLQELESCFRQYVLLKFPSQRPTPATPKKSEVPEPSNMTFDYWPEAMDDEDRNRNISHFYHKLKELKWIASNTDQDLLFRLFSGENQSFKIKWTTRVSRLNHLFKVLCEKRIIKPSAAGKNQILSGHFLDKNGKNVGKGLTSNNHPPQRAEKQAADLVAILEH